MSSALAGRMYENQRKDRGGTMSKVILGFVLGVIATLAVVVSIDTFNSKRQTSDAGGSSLHEAPAATGRTSSAGDIDEVADEQGEDPVLSMPVEVVANDVPQETQAQATVAPQEGREPVRTDQRSSTSPAKNQYPPEIAEMIENRVDKELQARYENDEREESWAAYMEGQLAAYFAQKPSLSQFYFSLIDCRTSVCSVHAIGYGPDALTQWNVATADLVSQQWMEFNSMSMNRRNPEPDILAIVLILTKKPPG